MRLFDVLGRRWSLRILWELRGEPLTFRGLQEACGDLSPSSLNQRLAELKKLSVVQSGESGYQLTDEGRALAEQLLGLHQWAEKYLAEVD